MTLGWGKYRRDAPRRPEVPLPDAAAKALAEVARRLDRDLTLSATTFGRTGVAVYAHNVADGAAGPVAHAWIDSPGLLCVELRCPPGDVWERAASAVAEMHGELLGALLTDPAVDLGRLDGLSEATKALVLAKTDVDHGPYRSVPAQIRAVARSTPDTVAVYAADGTLTYERFVVLADALAARIRSVTTDSRSLIPVLVADGLALPVSWAAAMTAGIGYVPVDPHWPEERIAHVLDLLDAPLVLCADVAAVPAAHRDRALPVDLAEYETLDDLPDPGPDDVVYGVYTSGTTGTPSCAVNLHRGLTNRLAFMDRWFGGPAVREVVLQNTRHTFDSAFWQLFWPLTTGGATVVPATGDHHDLQHTIDLIEAHEVTVTDFVPAVLSALLTLVRQRPATVGRLRSLRHLVVGGEQINPLDVHRLRELLPGLRVSNAYGPSEASIGMIFHEVEARDGDVVPLGRPIDNCVAIVVDIDGRPLPPGATGEIVIGGACVGDGYHGEPGRTAERFFDSPSGRMYRTGDLGHRDAEGRFHFGGRIDHQIKIGGVRIEPGEIETAALSCAGVQQAVALVVEQELVLVTTGLANSREVLAHLRSRLPRGSLPRRGVVVGELPLTAAGKIDRRRLASRVERPEAVPDPGADPVLAVLRTALRCPDLAVGEDFFAAGGNSLQAVAAVVELSDLFGVDVGVRDLADHPTASGLRELIARRDRVPVPSDLVAADLASLSTVRTPLRDKRDRTACTVLLTGATGFVGARLLYELLENTGLTVRCLVRGRDDSHARHRVLAALDAQRLEHENHAARITVVAGDLARTGFGLTAPRWRSLAEECDLVVHAGAMVNLLYDYRMHREPNVLGTAEVIRFARAAGGIPLHYISTLGVLYDHALISEKTVPEDIDIVDVTPPSSGYSLSKWAGERLVHAAVDLPVSVLRLGEVMPATDVAVPNTTALTHLLLTAFQRLDSVPAAAIRSDYSPVDTVARAVVEAVQDPTVLGRALHVYSPGTVRFDELTVGADRVPCLRFLARLRTAAAAGDVELGLLLAILEHRAGGRADDETAAREVLENLLQDNPALFTTSAARPKEPASA
ncbi:non-ribosomal peptide synthetase [Amycolatopsis azurea]|uniref:Non-ribosomal siderophore peptide synthetase n=1 Tax=Amycolatopsis azurea DSM 43854 TaxID=1238180 RepID=M2QF72_9PSEU|nr:amino acid adenylation domain-containing protein [Amycolatopsis azurea]EMD24687.1 non-ribosomal siderophore peptide synthetase [Amycolatopsis azurea DSM 43854]OOC08185.1 non-ribosomal siderophore peptide synthetase [Amycolatopsis azurea DSM 43854]